jgi:two-component system, LytTR family, sensor kinase
MKKILIVSVVSVLTGGAFFIFIFYADVREAESWLQIVAMVSQVFLPSILAGCGVFYFNRLLDGRLSWKHNYALRFLLGVGVSAVVGLVIGLGTPVCWHVLIKGMAWADVWVAYGAIAGRLAVLMVVAAFIWTVLYGALYAYHEFAYAQVEGIKAQRKQLELQFDALKSQISPHYLFNSLNTISSLLYKDARLAEDFIRRLAQTYHYILATKDRPWVLLSEEIEFVKSYHYLLQVRFEDNLRLEINLPANVLQTRIPPLTLQMLVENAVKHNHISHDKPLYVYISTIDNTVLRVINTKNRPETEAESFHVGLENIRQRYRYFTSREVVVKNEDQFTVHLPVIKPESLLKTNQQHSA